MFELEINVTQNDIDRGIASDCYLCPIARALARAADIHLSDELVGVSANNTYLNLRKANGERFEARTPIEASIFMNHFDTDVSVEPFSFRAQFN